MGVWLLGGLLSLNGALCYAELATTYPRSGGDYHYLTKAFGRWMGFLFGWAQLAVILTGSIASMAYAFADYGVQLWGAKPGDTSATLWLAAGSIVALSVMNLLGVVVGKSVQNCLSAVKILGLVGIFVAAMLCSSRGSLASPGTIEGPGLGLALVFVLYAYGGWSDAAFVAAEVRGRQRNLPLALFLGIGLITVIYLLVIMAYMVVLGFDGARASETPAADVMQLVVGDWGRSIISGLVMVSALGAINGLILTGSRIYASLGADHVIFARLSRWDQQRGAPAAALDCPRRHLLAVGARGRNRRGPPRDRCRSAGHRPSGLPWEKYFGGFETLVSGTAPVFWTFFLLTGISLFVLRDRDGQRHASVHNAAVSAAADHLLRHVRVHALLQPDVCEGTRDHRPAAVGGGRPALRDQSVARPPADDAGATWTTLVSLHTFPSPGTPHTGMHILPPPRAPRVLADSERHIANAGKASAIHPHHIECGCRTGKAIGRRVATRSHATHGKDSPCQAATMSSVSNTFASSCPNPRSLTESFPPTASRAAPRSGRAPRATRHRSSPGDRTTIEKRQWPLA